MRARTGGLGAMALGAFLILAVGCDRGGEGRDAGPAGGHADAPTETVEAGERDDRSDPDRHRDEAAEGDGGERDAREGRPRDRTRGGEVGPRDTTPDPTNDLPATIQDTIWIEGEPEEMTLELYEAADVFPRAFHTYLPEGIQVQELGTAEGYAVRFLMVATTATGGPAVAEILVFHEETLPEAAREQAEEMAEDMGIDEVTEGPYLPWAHETWRFRGRQRTGWLAVGEQSGHAFLWSVHYPAEFGDGFEPRVAEILRRWRWTEDGSPLQAPLP